MTVPTFQMWKLLAYSYLYVDEGESKKILVELGKVAK